MKKAIVTGANGFVGNAVCKELLKRGVEVIAVIRRPNERFSIDYKDQIRIVYSELSDYGRLDRLIPDRDVDALYHFAWGGSAGSLRGDLETQLNNIRFSCDSVKACAEMGCRRFVFASSIMEYEIQTIMETDATPGINSLYCSAKMAADYIVRTISGNLGVEYIRAVISNIYGPGEFSPRLINTSLRKMINGEYCAFTAGDQMYDFIYITDAARAFAEIGEKGKPNKTYYIGSQNPKPLKEYLLVMRDCVDSDIQIGLGDLPFSGPGLTYKEFDINAVRDDTGFTPEVGFDKGIANTIAWLKEIG